MEMYLRGFAAILTAVQLLFAAGSGAQLTPRAEAASIGNGASASIRQAEKAERAPQEAPAEAAPEAPDEPDEFQIVLSFAGDAMLASLKNQWSANGFCAYAAAQPPTYFLQHVRPIFDADDFTVVNLENTLTDRVLTPREKPEDPAYWFYGPTSNTAILTSSGVEAVSLANNHTHDYANAGYADTVDAVESAGLEWGDNDRTFYVEKNGYRIAVICHGLWIESQALTIARRVREAEACSDFQIVLYHGGKEKIHTPEAWKVRASRAIADAGADLVLGNHPHVLQPKENWNGTDIVYSLGNFCYGGSRRPENRTIIYQLTLTVRDGALTQKSGSIIPCYVYTDEANNYCPAPITDEAEKQRVLDFMDRKRNSPL